MKNIISNRAFNLIFALLTFLIIILFYHNILLACILLIFLTSYTLFRYDSKLVTVLFIFGLFFGTFAEIFSVYYGVWSYALPNFFGVPLWLFIVWGNAAIFIYRLGVDLKEWRIMRRIRI